MVKSSCMLMLLIFTGKIEENVGEDKYEEDETRRKKLKYIYKTVLETLKGGTREWRQRGGRR